MDLTENIISLCGLLVTNKRETGLNTSHSTSTSIIITVVIIIPPRVDGQC